MASININISFGELCDKLSILEIKKKYIKNEKKLKNINIEIELIKPYILNDIIKYELIYKCLYNINLYIWDLMEQTKIKFNDTLNFNKICKQIFHENESRCRCKKLLNIESNIIEEKSYNNVGVIFIGFNGLNENIKNSYIFFLKLYFDDVIYIDNENLINIEMINYNNIKFIYNILKIKNYMYNFDTNYNYIYNLNKKILIDINYNEINLNYLNSGELGDLIHVLYVVKYFYLTIGKKGNIYINTDNFSRGIDVYEDIKELLEAQEYIGNIFLYNKADNIKIDYDLDNWRNSHYLYKENWIKLLSLHYDLKELDMSWLKNYSYNENNDEIIINRSLKRNINNFPWINITLKNKCKFISFNKIDYDNFICKNNTNILYVNSFNEMVESLSNCKIFIGNQSAPLAIAIALGKNCFGELYYLDSFHYIGLKNLNWISESNQYINFNNLFIL